MTEGRIEVGARVVLFNCATGLKYPMPVAGIALDHTRPIDYSRL